MDVSGAHNVRWSRAGSPKPRLRQLNKHAPSFPPRPVRGRGDRRHGCHVVHERALGLANRQPRAGRPRAGSCRREGSGGPGVRSSHRRRQGPLRRTHLGRGQAGPGAGVDGLRSGRVAAALVAKRRRRAKPGTGRALVRRGAGALCGPTRTRGRRADRAHRQGGSRLSLWRRVPGVAGSELQHVHRLDRAGGAGAGTRSSGHGHRQGLPRQLHRRCGAERQRGPAVARRSARPGRERRRWPRVQRTRLELRHQSERRETAHGGTGRHQLGVEQRSGTRRGPMGWCRANHSEPAPFDRHRVLG